MLFVEQELESLKKCLDKTGDDFFYIIQNDFGNDELLTFRLKFPVTIAWGELISGNYISTVLFEMFHNDYFVFGDSLLWGKYCANDENTPIDIYGVKSSELSLFLTNFKDSRVINPESVLPDSNFPNSEAYCSTLSEVKDSLPDSYKDIYKIY